MKSFGAPRLGIPSILLVAVGLFPVAGLQSQVQPAKEDLLRGAVENARRTHDEVQLRAVEAQLNQQIRENPGGAAGYWLLAQVQSWFVNVYERRGDKKGASTTLDKAIESVQRSLQLEEKSADAHSLLADLYGRKISFGGFLSGAKYGPKVDKENRRAMELDPKNPRVWASLGRQFLMAPRMFGGDIGKAIESFRKSLDIDPEQDETWIWLAKAYQKAGDRAKAREAIEKALQLNPQNAFARDTAASIAK